MYFESQSSAWRGQKNHFFAQAPKSIDDFQQTILPTDYQFKLTNQKLIETEFSNVFATLRKQKDKENTAFWLWCYYCASLLEDFYSDTAYQHNKNKETYHNYKKQIEAHLNKTKLIVQEEKSFLDAMVASFMEIVDNLMMAIFHLSRLRDYVSISNLYRLFWVFTRITFINGLKLAQSMQWIENLDKFLHIHTDVNQIIAVLETPNLVLSYFSVALFVARFLIDSILLIRHTFFPSELENTTRWERFKYEIQKRHFRLANDFVWSLINFLTNLNQYSGISDPVTLYITAGFLFFDVLMAFYQLCWAWHDFLVKQAQYNADLAFYQNDDVQVAFINAQLIELAISWDVQKANFCLQAAGAALLAAGFTASLVFTLFAMPALVLCSYFVCTLGIALYLSGKAFSQYREKAEYLNYYSELDTIDSVARKEYEIARNEFIFALTKNILVPMVLITVFAIYWPAALVLTAVYLGIEAIHAYKQHVDSNDAKRLAFDNDDKCIESKDSEYNHEPLDNNMNI